MTKENNNFLLNFQTLLHKSEDEKTIKQSIDSYQELEKLAKEFSCNQLSSFVLTEEESFKKVISIKYETNYGREMILSGFKTKAFLIHHLFNFFLSIGSQYIIHGNILTSSTSKYENFNIIIKNYRQIKIPELRFLFIQLMKTQFIPLLKIDFNSTSTNYDSKYIRISLYLCR